MADFDTRVFDDAPIGMQVLDASSLVALWANRAYLEFLDEPFASEGIVGRQLDEYVPNAEASGLVDVFREVARTGVSYTSEQFEHVGFARGITYWTWTLHRIGDSRGAEGARLLNIASEITGQTLARRAQEQRFQRLSETYEFVSRVLDQVNMPISYIDDQLVYRLCNAAAARAIGLDVSQIVGRTLAEVMGENTHIYNEVKGVIETGRPFNSMLHFRDAEGKIRNYEVSYRADLVDDKVAGAVTCGIDLTDLIEAELALQRLNQAGGASADGGS